MNPAVKSRIIRILLLSVIALTIGAAVAWYQIQFQTARILKQGDTGAANSGPVAGLKIGGPFNLTDHTGKAVTEKDYEGAYKLIYFGFTYCPAICPTELQKIARVLNALGPYGDNIQPLFISVDPERDTPEVMREYVGLFHPRMIGLTGTQPQIDLVKKHYRIFSNKVQSEEMNDYTVDHSTFIYFMDPQNQLLSIYRIEDTAEFMIEDIKRKTVFKSSDAL